jgi:hypothetical protein
VVQRQPGFWQIIPLVYDDTIRMVRQMWPAVLVVAAVAAIAGIGADLISDQFGTRLGRGILTVLINAAVVWISAPYLLALYRCAASNEVVRRPEQLRQSPENVRFSAWLVLLGFIAGIPLVLYIVAIPPLPPEQLTSDNTNPVAILSLFAIAVAVWIFTIRSATLVPALALDPDRASLNAALQQTRGRFWLVVGIEFLTLAPVFLAGILLSDVVDMAAPILAPLVGALIAVATQVVQIAAATRIYRYLVGLVA